MSLMNQIFIKLKNEPPVAAAVITITVFTIPVFISIVLYGQILLPSGYTSMVTVPPIYGLYSLIINIILLCIFATAPTFRSYFHSIITPDIVRKALIATYLIISLYSLYAINVKLDFIHSLLDDPVLAMLRAGSDLVEENLLRYYYFGICGCIAFALIKPTDGFFLKAAGYSVTILIVLFYFFIGRREVSIMTLCILFLIKREKVSRVYLLLFGAIAIAIMVFILSLRVGDDSGFLFATNSEELSTVAYSSYAIERSSPNLPGSITDVTILRPYLNPLQSNISATFVKKESGYSDTAGPVLGIAGITYMYGFIIPLFNVFLFGSFFRTISREVKKNSTPVLKLLLIYAVFKSFNLFRNGEFPIVILDTVKFFLLIAPALYLKFDSRVDDKIILARQNNFSNE